MNVMNVDELDNERDERDARISFQEIMERAGQLSSSTRIFLELQRRRRMHRPSPFGTNVEEKASSATADAQQRTLRAITERKTT